MSMRTRLMLDGIACGWGLFAIAMSWTCPSAASKIACVGDSITYGYNLNNPSTESYPAVLQTLLGSAHTVKNFGSSGCTLLKKGDKPYWNDAQFSASDSFKPDVVVVMLGTNDAKPQNWSHQADFAGDYNSMIDHYRGLGALVYVAAPPPVVSPGAYQIDPDVLNTQIVPLVRQIATTANAPTIDVYQAFNGKTNLLPDTVHPNADGAKLIAQTVQTALQLGGYGGYAGTGGAAATGGVQGSGGVKSTGGASGTGGIGAGGALNNGGRSSTSSAIGGALNIGGLSSTLVQTGGASNSGGTSRGNGGATNSPISSGGNAMVGGTASTSAAPATSATGRGGQSATGGSSQATGMSSQGGAPSNGGTSASLRTATTRTGAVGGTGDVVEVGGSTAASTGGASSPAGCGCRIHHQHPMGFGAALIGLLMLTLLGRKRGSTCA